jgi:hypothetical protein
VICFQELFNKLNPFTVQVIDNANKAGLIYHCQARAPSISTCQAADAGLTILSRYPILYDEFHAF